MIRFDNIRMNISETDDEMVQILKDFRQEW